MSDAMSEPDGVTGGFTDEGSQFADQADQAERRADSLTPRERVAAQQDEDRRKTKRRRLWAYGGIAAALLAVLGIVISSLVGRSTPVSPGAQALPASVQPDLTVPRGTLAAIGLGSTSTQMLNPVTGPELRSHGKPELLYIGAEWCPYCAAERWPMAVALSRFGHFASPLQGVRSSPSDVYPSTATLTFHQADYTSRYLAFTPVETQDVNHGALQQVTGEQQALWTKYQPPGDSFPFVDIGNRFVTSTTYNPQVLHGKSWGTIASSLHRPSSPVAKGATGSANLLTAAICQLTGNQPGNVCNASPIPAIEHGLRH